MINFNDIGSWHFVSELDELVVTTSGDSLSVSIYSSDNTLLLATTYVPVDGEVRIYHLHRLLSPLISGVVSKFNITVGGMQSKWVNVVQSRVAVGEPASLFLQEFFLSAVMSERDTAVGRKELLTVLPIEATVPDVVAEASYWDGTKVVTSSRTLAQGLSSGDAAEIDVSASRLVDDTLGRLVAYTIVCGKRVMRYRVTSLPTAHYALLMRNNFGAWEPLYFQGMTESAPEYSRETAMVNGRLMLYNLEETDTLKCWTGPMRPAGVSLARDLARSREVVMLEDGEGTEAVVITAVEVKHSDEDNAIADMTFTWRRASMLSSRLMPIHIPKLFDKTFDETFN